MDRAVRMTELYGGGGYPAVPEEVRAGAGRLWDRDHSLDGRDRQWAAVRAVPDRAPNLRGVRVPSLVIHGREDVVVDLSGGEATAAAIPGCRLLVIDGMGHELPRPAWPVIVEAIVANARRADD